MKSFAQYPSKKYIADLRGFKEEKGYRCLSTFNYEAYQNEHRNPFGTLLVVNDEYLAPLHKISYFFEADLTIILIPLVGAIDFNSANAKGFVHIQQIQLLHVKKNETLTFENPYGNEWINFLQIRVNENLSNAILNFDYNPINSLQTVYSTPEIIISTGMFDSKAEQEYVLQNNNNGLFAMTLNGAFEAEFRLLENRDALCIWDFKKIEMESLTHNGIILLLEIKL